MPRLIIPALLVLTGALFAFTIAAPAIEAGGGGHGGCVGPPRDGTDEPVVIKDSCYSPAVLYVQPGATVEWQQKDLVSHNVKFFTGEFVGDNRDLYAGKTVTQSFDDPGVYAYYCTIHPSMLGVVVVGDPASPAFSANLTLQSGDATAQTFTVPAVQRDIISPQTATELPSKVQPPRKNLGWGEALMGLGLFGGLLVGLVAVGGGIKRHRRMH